MENAPFALTRRWTLLSTPADTCVCATTAGWSWSDRSMHAVRYAGDPLKMWSRRIDREGFFFGRLRCFFLRLCWPQSWSLIWRLATPGYNCARVKYTRRIFLSGDWLVLFIHTTVVKHTSLYILTEDEETTHVLLFCIFHLVLTPLLYIPAEQKALLWTPPTPTMTLPLLILAI